MSEISQPVRVPSLSPHNQSLDGLWVNSRGKRALDFVVAAICLLICAPILALCAVLIKLSSPGPVLFRQTRVGRDGRRFQVFKLRTMRVSASAADSKVTQADDHRITAVGRFLRNRKLDEIPQLVNVLRGEMSLVGPRPLVPEQAKHIFPCRPGVTGVGSLAFRNQEQILRLVHPDHITRVHAEVLTERRIETECDYMLNSSPWSDLNVVLQSALAVSGLTKRTPYDVDVRGLIVNWASRVDRNNTTRWFRPEYTVSHPGPAEAAVKPRVRAAGA